MSKTTWTAKRITTGFTKQEVEKLEKISQETGRSVTDIIREAVRNLPE
jgi:predicted DNA-binding protein